jgi:hypothetical protein
MLIKGVKKKKGIPLTPDEAVAHAVVYGLRKLDMSKVVKWAFKNTLKAGSAQVSPKDKKKGGGWIATASGTIDIGTTDVKTGRFSKARPHTFSVEYESTKDRLGQPDIKVNKFDHAPIEMNPAKGVPPVAASKPVIQAGELKPEPTAVVAQTPPSIPAQPVQQEPVHKGPQLQPRPLRAQRPKPGQQQK